MYHLLSNIIVEKKSLSLLNVRIHEIEYNYIWLDYF